jgi:hypothetical protein
LPNLPAFQFFAPSIPAGDRIQVQDWAGLNDCAHFVSECLKEGGVHVYAVAVGKLVKQLRDLSYTKTLALSVDKSTAERIVKSGVMQEADIIAFGGNNNTFFPHAHSVVFMGNNKVANHTHLNHPSFTGGGGVFGQGIWQRYADPTTGHPEVTLVHFSEGDADPATLASSPTLGWWEVNWRGTMYYYYFVKTGQVSYTKTKPSHLHLGPGAPVGRGYWFESSTDLKICWTATGSLEVFVRTPAASTMSGTWNDSEPIGAKKMS